MADSMLGLDSCVAAGNPAHRCISGLVHLVVMHTGLCRLSSGMHTLLCLPKQQSPCKEWPRPPL